MAKINTAKKPHVVKDASEKKPRVAKEGKAERNKAPAFERARGRVTRSFKQVSLGASYLTALESVIGDDSEFIDAVREGAKALNSAAQWLDGAMAQFNLVPEGTEMPSVKTRGTRRGGVIAIGTKVELKETKTEQYEGVFAEGEDNVFEVLSSVGGGKRFVVKTSTGDRLVIPAAHLRPAA